MQGKIREENLKNDGDLEENQITIFRFYGGIRIRIEHIALYVNDLKGARDFFVRYFGASANDGYHNPTTGLRSYFLTFEDGYPILSGPRTTGDGYYESCILGFEGNQIEVTV